MSIIKKYRHQLRLSLRFLAYVGAFFFIFFGFWINHNFGTPSLEQILYHMQFGMEGMVDTDIRVIHSFIRECLLIPFAIALSLLFIEVALAYYLVHRNKTRHTQQLVDIEKWGRGIYWLIHHRAPVYALLAGFVYFSVQFSLLTYMAQKFGRDYFSENYLNPKMVNISLNAPKNLILIYVESLENSYRDPKLFGRNLLKSLDDIGGEQFEFYRQAPGTNWTIAGITATQCGLPLKSITLYDGNAQGQNIKSFLPNAICLGDVLHAHGYYNVYMGGDALAFSGKGKFFADHHYDERYGRDELQGQLTKAQLNWWGLYDDDLLAKAKTKLVSLHQKKAPFNLTITTIDTHGPDGYYSKLCHQLGAKQFTDIVECTAKQVADFVNFVKQKGYLKDTNIVILGDHLAMYNPEHEALDSIPTRYIYNQLISRTSVIKTRDHVLHFDMFPTILEFIGFKVKGGKLGLGYTSITPNLNQPAPHELEQMEEDLLNESDTYIKLWKNDSGATDTAKTKPPPP